MSQVQRDEDHRRPRGKEVGFPQLPSPGQLAPGTRDRGWDLELNRPKIRTRLWLIPCVGLVKSKLLELQSPF